MSPLLCAFFADINHCTLIQCRDDSIVRLRICQNTPGMLSDSDPGERKLETVANIRERTCTVFILQNQFKGKLNGKFLLSPRGNSLHHFLLSENGLLYGSRFSLSIFID